MKKSLWLAALAVMAADDHPSGARTTPPTIRQVAPLGMARGTTIEVTVEGFNLAGARRVFFSEPGVTAKILRVKELPDLNEVRLGANGTPSTIDLGPLPPRNQVTMEVEIAPEAGVGPVNFRIETPLGTSPSGTLLVEPYYGESPDNEPNDTLDNAFETYLPSVLAGTISRPGDVDYFKIKVKAGDEIVFSNAASQVGSQLQPIVAIVDESMQVLREFGTDGGISAEYFSFRFEKAGTFYVRVSDYQQKGSGAHFYRIKVGDFAVVSRAYPLGLRRDKEAPVAVSGLNLAAPRVTVRGEASPDDPDVAIVRVEGKSGASFNRLRLDLGADPEVEASQVKTLAFPLVINGKLTAKYQDFRFRATKGQKLVFEVRARRFGSELDSFLEVLDAAGKPIERAVVRPVWETTTVLRDHDSSQRGIRIQSWNVLKSGDYVAMHGEVARVDTLPRQPDEDMLVESFNGQRLGFFGTTPEAHAADSSVYKVEILPPGSKPSPNGLPVMRLYYRNDDGGPAYGKDSLVDFTAPADGEYVLRLSDVRGVSGEEYSYRLSARAPRPDFRLAVNPRNPNVPAGGTVPLTVTAMRMEGFEDPIEVEVEGLPKGLTATKAVVPRGQVFATVLLSAALDTKLTQAAPMKVMGRAKIGGAIVARAANPEDRLQLIAVTPKPDVVMTAQTRVVELPVGGTADISVSIIRQNGFGGRVPVEVRGLPPRVRVDNSGLNGVLLNETETERTFRIEALPTAEEVEQTIYVSALVETRSPQQNSFAAPQPILLRVKKTANPTAIPPAPTTISGAPKK